MQGRKVDMHLGRAAVAPSRLFEPAGRDPWEVSKDRPWEGVIRPPSDYGKRAAPELPPYLKPETLPEILTPEPSPRAESADLAPEEAEPSAEAAQEEADTVRKSLLKNIKSIRRARDVAATRERAPRMGRAVYSAWETHGSFGLIDAGETRQGCRLVTLHVPQFSHGYTLDFVPGDEIHATSIGGKTRAVRLDVHFVTRSKYYPPGTRVTSCVVGVPEDQWARLVG